MSDNLHNPISLNSEHFPDGSRRDLSQATVKQLATIYDALEAVQVLWIGVESMLPRQGQEVESLTKISEFELDRMWMRQAKIADELKKRTGVMSATNALLRSKVLIAWFEQSGVDHYEHFAAAAESLKQVADELAASDTA